MFALVDCNNFYASCERIFNPALLGKPVVVLSNNDGCVIARSNEAKKAGIPMGAPAFQYQEIFKKHDVKVFSANFELYGDMSQRVMDILSEFSPEVEVYSIDEIFIKLEGYELFDLKQMGIEMMKKVKKWTGIPISVGIAPTKALAKVANRIAKKYPTETQGTHVIDNQEKIEKALKWLEIEDVWGIGRQHAKRLRNININNAFEFTQLPESWVKKNMAIVGLRLQQDLKGIPTLDLEEIAHSKKSIATTRSFEKMYTHFDEVKERVSSFAFSCAEKLRLQKSYCNSFMLFVRSNPHRQELGIYTKNIVVQLPFPTQSAIELSKFATDALKRIFAEGYYYKKAGLIVMDLVPEDQLQLNLLENSDIRHKNLMETLDKLNSKLGKQKIRLASQDLKRVWKMKQEKLSPKYTTRLSDIIIVKS
ncbi:MAG: Y-family DNA polymerase [Cytophagales bacterium]